MDQTEQKNMQTDQKPEGGCMDIIAKLKSVIAEEYPELTEEAMPHIKALEELLSSNEDSAEESDINDMMSTKEDPMNKLMNSTQ